MHLISRQPCKCLEGDTHVRFECTVCAIFRRGQCHRDTKLLDCVHASVRTWMGSLKRLASWEREVEEVLQATSKLPCRSATA